MLKQNTLFGSIPATITSAGTIRHEGRGTLVPNLKNDVQFVYDEAEKTFALVKELLPNLQMELVTTKERMESYMQSILSAGVVAIDTETDGINPILDRIAGASLYTPKESSIYVPINHDFYEHNLDIRWFFHELLEHVKSGRVRVVMHNARFDMQVLKEYAQVWIPCFADTMVAAHMINENEPKGLKIQWNKYRMGGRYTEMAYNDLFEKRKYSTFNPEKVYIYAALDTVMTLQLWEYQFQFVGRRLHEGKYQYGPQVANNKMESVSDWFWDTEMKVLQVATEMEYRGLSIDLDRNAKLRQSYALKIRDVTKKGQAIAQVLLETYGHKIPRDKFLKLSNPISISSNAQLATLLYDGYGVKLSDKMIRNITRKKMKTSTTGNIDLDAVGKNELKYLAGEYPDLKEFIDVILELRGLEIIESTFLTSLRTNVNPNTGKVHGGWNNIGTKTGRFSSSKPNLYYGGFKNH